VALASTITNARRTALLSASRQMETHRLRGHVLRAVIMESLALVTRHAQHMLAAATSAHLTVHLAATVTIVAHATVLHLQISASTVLVFSA